MILKDSPKRLGIYFIYDKDGIIDEYIIYQLKDLKKSLSFLHCVINGNLTDEGKEKLEVIADEVFIRENKGVDVGAYKAAFEYIGWDEVSKYDEVVLMNNTCFGPVYPLEEVFDWAKCKNVEFWGLTYDLKSDWLGTSNYLHYNKDKKHMQSNFLVFRKPLIGSKFLIDFFREIPDDLNYMMSGSVFEAAFPGYFEEYGYKGAVYCDDEDINYPLLHNPVHLFKTYRMPLFKKRSFFHHYTDVMNNSGGEATYELIRFIETETNYDMSMVWKSILRTASLSDIVRCAQLNRVLSSKAVIGDKKNTVFKVGVVYHAFYEDLFDESVKYFNNFPERTEFLITTNTIEKKELLRNKLNKIGIDAQIVVVGNRGRDISALLVGAADFVKKFDLVCFAHDKKTSQIKPTGIGRSWFYKLNQNMFATKEYVTNVINTFEQEELLGIAFPSPPNHHVYSHNIGSGWLWNFQNTSKLLKDFGVNVKMNEHTLCVAPLGTCFWFRPKALEKIFKGYNGKGWRYEDFPREPNRFDQTILHAIERAYAYFAQDAGYYPVYLYNSEFAAIELTNLEFFKAGSGEMRSWTEKLAIDAIGERTQDSSEHQVSVYDQKINYGIKQSLLHLAYAIRCKYPKFWGFLLPMRRLGQKILNIKTK